MVTISNGGDKPVRLLYNTSTLPGVFAMLPRKPLPPGDEISVAI